MFDPLFRPYPKSRYPVVSKNGMVASSSALASSAGLEILKKGGNAIDAAIATSAVLLAVEPFSCSLGGDAFAIVSFKDKIYGLNASGYSPASLTIDKLKELGYEKMPERGWIPVMVPGLPKGWQALNEKFGNLSLKECLKPAIKYCLEGFPLSPTVGDLWSIFYHKDFMKYKYDQQYSEFFKVYTKNGEPYKYGDIVYAKDLAKTLDILANTNCVDFYQGEIAHKIIRQSERDGGFLKPEDLNSYDVEWVEPLSINYHGYDVCELPPNGQGLVALIALNILKNFKFKEKDNIKTYHTQFEAIKIAFSDALNIISDPDFNNYDYNYYLSKEYGLKRANELSDTAKEPLPIVPPKSGTVYLATADKDGNMVSYIQSNYMDFGSGIVIEDLGFALQNRGHDFSLDPGHVNCLMPHKRSYHTIIPGFLSKDNKAIGPFGVMGAYMQPQGHLQVLMNMLDFNLDPQQALDAPRWQWIKGKEFLLEKEFNKVLFDELKEKGHLLQYAKDSYSFGRGQIILKDERGFYIGGTESRCDGSIAAY